MCLRTRCSLPHTPTSCTTVRVGDRRMGLGDRLSPDLPRPGLQFSPSLATPSRLAWSWSLNLAAMGRMTTPAPPEAGTESVMCGKWGTRCQACNMRSINAATVFMISYCVQETLPRPVGELARPVLR